MRIAIAMAVAVLAMAIAALCSPRAAQAATTVSLRVEGPSSTLFDGVVVTAPGAIDGGDGSGAHPCEGEHLEGPQPTAGGVLASAGLSWEGSWFADFQDFFVNRIGPDASRPPFAYWSLLVDWRYAGGACHTTVHEGDEVLWAYDTAERPLILRLRGPAHVKQDETFTVSVRDGWLRANGADGGPVAGAAIGDAMSGNDGLAQIEIAEAGLFVLRARRAGAIASNTLAVCVGDVTCRAEAPSEGLPSSSSSSTSTTGTANPSPQQKTNKGAANAKKAPRGARRCVVGNQHRKRHTGARRNSRQRVGQGRGRHLDAAGTNKRQNHYNSHAPTGKLLGHNCRRRATARQRRKLGSRSLHSDNSRRDT